MSRIRKMERKAFKILESSRKFNTVRLIMAPATSRRIPTQLSSTDGLHFWVFTVTLYYIYNTFFLQQCMGFARDWVTGPLYTVLLWPESSKLPDFPYKNRDGLSTSGSRHTLSDTTLDIFSFFVSHTSCLLALIDCRSRYHDAPQSSNNRNAAENATRRPKTEDERPDPLTLRVSMQVSKYANQTRFSLIHARER